MKNFINFLPPWVETNIQPAFYDKESGSVLQQTARMYAKVNQLVRCFNNLSKETKETIDEYIAKFVELKDYVDTYFENLDVQEEINNKLDEMAESGVLEQIITEYYQGYINVIFPLYGADGTDTLGDCSIIKNGEESLMIDTFSNTDETYDSIRDALYNASISTLTYLVITHYHSDHIGNVLNLLNDGYLAGCTVYLPRNCTIGDYTWEGTAIKNALTTAGVTWIEINNQTFTVGDDCTVKMLNGSAEDYQYYDDLESESGNNSYNDRSIVCDVEYKGRHLLFTGDLEYRGCEYIAPQLSASNYDLLKDMHHGFIDNAPDFCARVNPNFVVIPASAGMVNKNYSDWLINSVYWIRKSKNVAIQGYQSKEINLRIDINGVHPNKEINFVNDFSCRGGTPYYVDYTTADEVRNGSQDHPFKTINEAMVFIQKDTPNEIYLYIQSMPITQRTIYVEGFKNLRLIFADGVTVKNYVTIDNCHRVLVKNLKQSVHNIAINNSEVILENYENTSGENCINAYFSKVLLTGTLNLNIDTSNAILARYNTEITIDTSSNGLTLTYADDTNKRFISGYHSTIYFGANAITQLKSYGFNTQIMPIQDLRSCVLSPNAIELRALYSNSTGTYSGGTFKESLDGYHVLTIEYMDKDNYRRTIRCSRWNSHSLSTIVPRVDNQETYIRSAILTLTSSGFTLSSNNETCVRHNSNTTIVTGNIIRVIGIYGEPGYAV